MTTLNVFCASGGGSKGAFQGGVLEALCEAGITLDAFVGVSTGSIQAAFMSLAEAGLEHQNAQLQSLKELWFGLAGDASIYRKPPFGKLGLAWRLLWGKPSLYSFAPFQSLIEAHVQHEPKRPVGLGVVRLATGEFDLRRPRTAQELSQGVLASSSIPFFFPPVEPDQVDGGVRDIAPLASAFDLARELLQQQPGKWDGVHLYVALASPINVPPLHRPAWSAAGALDVATRSLDILEDENYAWDIAGARQINELLEFFQQNPDRPLPPTLRDKILADLTIFEPDESLYSPLTFDPPKIRAYWQRGLEKARSQLAAS
jgi:hypothetical protein